MEVIGAEVGEFLFEATPYNPEVPMATQKETPYDPEFFPIPNQSPFLTPIIIQEDTQYDSEFFPIP